MRQVWHRKFERPGHADDWLMTYADVITLLLCFFAVSFLALSAPKHAAAVKEPPQAPVEKAAQPQPTPKFPPASMPRLEILNPSIAQSAPVSASLLSFVYNPPGAAPAHEDQKPKATLPTANSLPPAATPAPIAANAAAQKTPDAQQAKNTADAVFDRPSPSLQAVLDRVTAETANLATAGDRIPTLQMNNEAFFSSGSAVLSDSGKQILLAVAGNLKSQRFQDYRITVEGHTDDAPIDTAQFPSNWELSTARASAVVHYLLDQGIPAQRLRAAGYADTFPIAPNRDAEGKPIPENQALNRRVVIKLEKIEKAD